MFFAPMIAQLLLALIFAGGLLVWARILSKFRQREPILLRQWQQPVPWEGIDVLFIIAAFVAAQFVCLWFAVRTFGLHWPIDASHRDPQVDLAILSGNLAANIEIFLIGLCILRLRAGATLPEIGLDLRYFSEDVYTGLAAFLAAAPIVYGVQLILVEVVGIKYEHPLIDAVKEAPSALMLTVATVSAVVVAPVVEEFLFRVVLQGWLEKMELRLVNQPPPTEPAAEPIVYLDHPGIPIYTDVPPVPADARGLFGLPLGAIPILLSSTLFALVHWGQGAAPIPLFVLALVLGYVYQRTHRLIPSMTVHMALNGVSMIMFFADPLNNW
jgi:membrane protease YdiL (CAAX protease family)